jgi:hypothetical protein
VTWVGCSCTAELVAVVVVAADAGTLPNFGESLDRVWIPFSAGPWTAAAASRKIRCGRAGAEHGTGCVVGGEEGLGRMRGGGNCGDFVVTPAEPDDGEGGGMRDAAGASSGIGKLMRIGDGGSSGSGACVGMSSGN